MTHQTHYSSYLQRVLKGQMTQPTVSKNRNKGRETIASDLHPAVDTLACDSFRNLHNKWPVNGILCRSEVCLLFRKSWYFTIFNSNWLILMCDSNSDISTITCITWRHDECTAENHEHWTFGAHGTFQNNMWTFTETVSLRLI